MLDCVSNNVWWLATQRTIRVFLAGGVLAGSVIAKSGLLSPIEEVDGRISYHV